MQMLARNRKHRLRRQRPLSQQTSCSLMQCHSHQQPRNGKFFSFLDHDVLRHRKPLPAAAATAAPGPTCSGPPRRWQQHWRTQTTHQAADWLRLPALRMARAATTTVQHSVGGKTAARAAAEAVHGYRGRGDLVGLQPQLYITTGARAAVKAVHDVPWADTGPQPQMYRHYSWAGFCSTTASDVQTD